MSNGTHSDPPRPAASSAAQVAQDFVKPGKVGASATLTGDKLG
jgi:hypothetical protein